MTDCGHSAVKSPVVLHNLLPPVGTSGSRMDVCRPRARRAGAAGTRATASCGFIGERSERRSPLGRRVRGTSPLTLRSTMDVSRNLSIALRVPPGWPAATLDRTRPTRQERAARRLYLLTELLTRLAGTRRRRSETPPTATESAPWSARLAGTPETPKTYVVWQLPNDSGCLHKGASQYLYGGRPGDAVTLGR